MFDGLAELGLFDGLAEGLMVGRAVVGGNIAVVQLHCVLYAQSHPWRSVLKSKPP
jgi:hypothetical protein